MKKVLFILIALAFLVPNRSEAAIAFDAASAYRSGTGVSSLTGSHTVTGTDTILFVYVAYLAQDRTVSSVTYNGTALTAIYANQNFASAYYLGLYYLINPSTGANDIVVNMSGSVTQKIGFAAASYTGAKQSGQPDANNQELSSASVSSRTLSLTTVADNAWLVGGMISGDTVSAGTDTTIRNSQPAGFDLAIRIYDSNGPKSPAGSHSLAMQVSPDNFIPMQIASFAPSVAAAAATPRFGDIIFFE